VPTGVGSQSCPRLPAKIRTSLERGGSSAFFNRAKGTTSLKNAACSFNTQCWAAPVKNQKKSRFRTPDRCQGKIGLSAGLTRTREKGHDRRKKKKRGATVREGRRRSLTRTAKSYSGKGTALVRSSAVGAESCSKKKKSFPSGGGCVSAAGGSYAGGTRDKRVAWVL